jgi:hypothetical protein
MQASKKLAYGVLERCLHFWAEDSRLTIYEHTKHSEVKTPMKYYHDYQRQALYVLADIHREANAVGGLSTTLTYKRVPGAGIQILQLANAG